MYKDWKIGLAAGLILALIAVIRLAVDPRLGIKARLSYNQNTTAKQMLVSPPSAFAQSQTIDDQSTEPAPTVNYFDKKTTYSQPQVIDVNIKKTIFSQAQSPPKQDEQVNPQVESPNQDHVEIIKTQRFHIVQKDQSLWSISNQYYGKGDSWKKILEANRSVIKDPNKITVGTRLIIPE
jgi:nucleoid-associated protein YgaU